MNTIAGLAPPLILETAKNCHPMIEKIHNRTANVASAMQKTRTSTEKPTPQHGFFG